MCDSARCPQATHHPRHRPAWANTVEDTTVFLGALGRTRTAERARLQAELDRAQRVLDAIDAAASQPRRGDHADQRERRRETEQRIRAAAGALLRGDIPPGGKCDITTLARQAGVSRATLYRSYPHLKEEFESGSPPSRPAEPPRPPRRPDRPAQSRERRLRQRLAGREPPCATSRTSGARAVPAGRPARRDQRLLRRQAAATATSATSVPAPRTARPAGPLTPPI